jgi:hypothetical protein
MCKQVKQTHQHLEQGAQEWQLFIQLFIVHAGWFDRAKQLRQQNGSYLRWKQRQ